METSTKRYWLTADRSAIVEDGHARAAHLLIGEGAELTAEVKRLLETLPHLSSDTVETSPDADGLPSQTSEVETLTDVETKDIDHAPFDKAVKAKTTK